MKNSYSNVISCLTEKMSERFQDLKSHPIVKSIVILGSSLWPRDDLNLSVYGEKEIDALSKHSLPCCPTTVAMLTKLWPSGIC